MTRKNRYQALIATYKKRRETVKEEIEKRYKKRIARFSYKIKLWSRQISRIEKRQARIHSISLLVEQFTECPSLKLSLPSVATELVEARSLLFKYCLEEGIRPIELAEYTGCNRNTPAISRRRLNRRMATRGSEYQLWKRFKIFMEENVHGKNSTSESD